MIVFNKVTWYSKLAALVLFVGIMPVLTFYVGTQEATKDALLAVQNSISSSNYIPANHTQPATSLNSDAYPLYSGLSWSTVSSSTENITGNEVVGTRVTSVSIPNVGDISSVTNPFRDYYDNKLKDTGWTTDNSLSADGAGSSVWGYVKGNSYLIFSYISADQNASANKVFSCPCSTSFSIWSGSILKK